MPSLAAGTANNCFEWTLFFIISLREMMKNSVHSKFSFATAGGRILFTQPRAAPRLSTQSLAENGMRRQCRSMKQPLNTLIS
jgi:hypothetical protein